MMKTEKVLLLFVAFFLLRHSLVNGKYSKGFSKNDFPPAFVFGAGTSAFQYEGAAHEDGRAPSVMDIYAKEVGLTGTSDIASDGYHKYNEDVKLMSELGLDGYRFSVSWSRILPNGSGEVNPKGIQYYNNVIDALINHGIAPQVTLFHFDYPQLFEDEYGGWLNPKIIDDFSYFADVCFREFGDRVTHWTTINEANLVAMFGYDYGLTSPQRCSKRFNLQGIICKEGNSSTEPYIVAHNMILAHSEAVEVYKNKYKAIQKGQIGINLWTVWTDPLANTIEDKMAAQRTLDFLMGWFLDPLVFGDYPKIMKQIVSSRLPSFTVAESQKVKGAFDFIGANYYFPLYVANNMKNLTDDQCDMFGDMFSNFTAYKDSSALDKIVPPDPLPTNPWGLPKLLKYLSKTYNNPIFYIQENGYGIKGEEGLNDIARISYLSGYIGSILKAIRDGSDVRGYSVWSFVDVFEPLLGLTIKMGLYHVNFSKLYKRTPKQSALWYSRFLKNNSFIDIEEESIQLQGLATHPAMLI